MIENNCALCCADGGFLLAKTPQWRLVRAVDQASFPLIYRVVWHDHQAEFSDLSTAEQHICMDVVCWVEKAVRQFLEPDKVNLATLGNVVPHLHWHVIPRYSWDSRFPSPIWASAVREVDDTQWSALQERQDALEAYLIKGFK